MADGHRQSVGEEWVTFPGGELEGRRPKVLCPACRAALKAATNRRVGSADRAPRALCFQCYRAGLERDRRLRSAAELDTASDERFQTQLPFEPVDKPRLAMLKAEHDNARRGVRLDGTARFAEKRRQAQMAARRALQAFAARAPIPPLIDAHVAELQLPESWLPFVVSR